MASRGGVRGAAGLHDEELAELREAFNLFDTDKSGAISASELKAALQALGVEAKHATIAQMIADIDRDAKGQVTFDAFVAMMTAQLTDRDSKEDAARVFRLFDHDGRGTITIRDLRRVAAELGETIPGPSAQGAGCVLGGKAPTSKRGCVRRRTTSHPCRRRPPLQTLSSPRWWSSPTRTVTAASASKTSMLS